jgi:hypothetical protein
MSSHFKGNHKHICVPGFFVRQVRTAWCPRYITSHRLTLLIQPVGKPNISRQSLKRISEAAEIQAYSHHLLSRPRVKQTHRLGGEV